MIQLEETAAAIFATERLEQSFGAVSGLSHEGSVEDGWMEVILHSGVRLRKIVTVSFEYRSEDLGNPIIRSRFLLRNISYMRRTLHHLLRDDCTGRCF